MFKLINREASDGWPTKLVDGRQEEVTFRESTWHHVSAVIEWEKIGAKA